MKTIKSLKDITTLEVGDVIVFGNLEYRVYQVEQHQCYFLDIKSSSDTNDKIFKSLNLNKRNFIEQLGIDAPYGDFPETKSLEALTAVVSALFKEYEKQNELPKTWEEFCKRNSLKKGECVINIFGNIFEAEEGRFRNIDEDRNYCISRSEAEAFLSLTQLRQLRKCYVGDWEPDWKKYDVRKYIITFNCDNVYITARTTVSHPMSFPTYELAEQFLTNFKNLFEVAKPLL